MQVRITCCRFNLADDRMRKVKVCTHPRSSPYPHTSATTTCHALDARPRRGNAHLTVDPALCFPLFHHRPNHPRRRSVNLGESQADRQNRTKGGSLASAKTVSRLLSWLAHARVSPMSILGSTHTSHWFSSGEGVMRFSGSTSGMPIL